jgi:hypothetical protein
MEAAAGIHRLMDDISVSRDVVAAESGHQRRSGLTILDDPVIRPPDPRNDEEQGTEKDANRRCLHSSRIEELQAHAGLS